LVQPRVLIVGEPEERLDFYGRVIGDLATIAARAGTDDLVGPLQENPAVILLNFSRPGHDGLETAAHIRGLPGARRTPLLLIGSADPPPASIAGPVDCLPVPVVPEALRTKVRLFVDLQQATVQVAQLNEQFLAIMLHELRTPLNAILGWTTLLRTGRVDGPTAQRALETIERNARAQAHLIDELQDLARVVTGNLQLELADVDPRSVVEAAVAAQAPAADARQIRLHRDIAQPAVPVRADFGRLRQVIGNLLANAIRLSPEGGQVTVRVDSGAQAVRISVADTGPGIAPELLPRLFDRFGQDDGAAGHRRGGLGLTIVRRLVELHGGTVSADSAGEGQGATFTVRIPTGVTLRQGAPSGRPDPARGGPPPGAPG
jgi:signal transduction histidine kinase